MFSSIYRQPSKARLRLRGPLGGFGRAVNRRVGRAG